MPYVKTNWIDNTTPANAVNFNKIESGIETATLMAENASNPNLIINGDFQVWQRGSVIPCTPGVIYTADRWVMWSGGSPTISNGGWSLNWLTAGNDNLMQIVEIPYRLISTNLILSFKINVPVGVVVNISASGCTSATNADTEVGKAYTGIGAWDTVTLAIPASYNTKALFRVRLSTLASAKMIYVTNIKLEAGSIVTPFIARPVAQELALCQRYYEKSYSYDNIPSSYSFNGALAYPTYLANWSNRCVTGFTVAKRIPPTVSVYRPDTGVAGNAYYNNNNIGMNIVDVGTAGFAVFPAGPYVVGSDIRFQYIADSEIY